ncbi:MAG TPA: tetratricopeptide repeat protein [Ignavibacteria bacterium]|nr:hypothetical protein [Bacteroidota bacterium]HRE10720.1 tetratricopeptide repeat protein [Ignavibacteria bacterium]HRF66749.1 tetratricopeptide repeat protein [Ignavibacteria bacterium]HRJ04093.1 tetratricopeptide repeat protein [Ignavibacteria bacterium]HRJ86082.1 tetratricopeptide repeat protein [Ignavibacteria bacterium]
MNTKNTKTSKNKTHSRFSSYQKKRSYLILLTIIILGVFSYSSNLNNSFTNWDDEEMLVNNQDVRSLSPGNIYNIFTNYHHSHYHPLVNISYAIEYHFFGLKPFVYHFTNLLFHILNTILVYFVLLKLFRNNFVAALAALLFVVHPLHVESVAWITERKDMLYSFFFLLALLFYLKNKQSKSKRSDLYIYLFFILACLSKAPAVVFPVVLVLVDYVQNSKITFDDIKQKAPLIMISIIFGIINIMAQYQQAVPGSVLEIPQLGIFDKILIVFYDYCFYIYKTLVPVNLSPFYPFPNTETMSLPVVFWLAPFITGLIAYVVYLSRKLNTVFVFGILFYTITILPVLQIVPVGRAITADRFAYIPLIGLLLIFSFLIFMLYDKYIKIAFYRKAVIAVLSLLLITLAYLSRLQNMVWENSMTLYTEMIKQSPDNPIGYNNRGTLYLNDKKIAEAERDFLSAIKCNSRYAAAYNNMGMVLSSRTQYDKAIEYFKKATELNGNYAEAYFNEGFAFYNKNEIEKAIEFYKKAISVDPNFAIAYNNLGKAYGMREQNAEAIFNFSKAVEIDPEYSTARFNLAVAYLKSGNNKSGIEQMKIAARLGNPGAIDFCAKNNIPLN